MPLYVVSTPVGNVEDVTRRALRVLGEVDLVLAEDTRDSGRLLARLGINARFKAFHDHSSDKLRSRLVEELVGGTTMALITDAGTPCISDPGYALVRDARIAGVEVVPIPGASALLTFLAGAGLPSDRFQFVGFPPRKGGQRRSEVEAWLRYPGTTVSYESPKRIVALLEDVAAVAPEASVCVGRELTKKFEEFIFGTAATVLSDLSVREQIKGEIVLGVVGETRDAEEDDVVAWLEALIGAGVRTKDAATLVSERLGFPRRDAYQLALALRESVGGGDGQSD
jgi:16S rRNA (cytidine1402-2'-O)-methyltransferase